MTRPIPWRELPASSSFAGDDGTADPELAALLAAHARGSAPLTEVVACLARTRVLLPLITGVGAPGEGACQPGETDAPSGIVAIAAPDGRSALPVFTSVSALAAWHADARPYPALAPRAALSAVSEDWSLLVVDPGGPYPVVIPRTAVWAVAQGFRWSPAVVDGVVVPDVAAAVHEAVAPLAWVASVAAEPGRKAEVAVVLKLDAGLDRAGLDRVLLQVNEALAASQVIARRVDSLELRIGKA